MGGVRGRRPTVFISYAHDNAAHSALVEKFAAWIQSHNFLVTYDEKDVRPGDLHAWMDRQVRTSDFVLCVASPYYKQAFDMPTEQASAASRGVRHEASAIREEFARDRDKADQKILTVVLPDSTLDHVPDYLRPFSRYHYEGPKLRNLIQYMSGDPSVNARPLPWAGEVIGALPDSPPPLASRAATGSSRRGRAIGAAGAVLVAAVLASPVRSSIADRFRSAPATGVGLGSTSTPVTTAAVTTTARATSVPSVAASRPVPDLTALCAGKNPWILLAGEKEGMGKSVAAWFTERGCTLSTVTMNSGEATCAMPALTKPPVGCPTPTDDMTALSARLRAGDWPVAWLVSSSLFIKRLAGTGADRQIVDHGSLMTNEISVGIRSDRAAQLDGKKPFCVVPKSMADIVSLLSQCDDAKAWQLGRSDPARSATGFATSYLLSRLPNAQAAAAVFESHVRASQASAPQLLEDGIVDIAIAEDKTFRDCNLGDCKGAKLRATYLPASATKFMAQPLNAYSDNPWVSFVKSDPALVNEMAAYLEGPSFRSLVEAYNFTPAAAKPANAVGAAAVGLDLGTLNKPEIDTTISTFRDAAAALRVLMIVDGSGSMGPPACPSTRFDDALAAVRAAKESRPKDQVMTVLFASNRADGLRWESFDGSWTATTDLPPFRADQGAGQLALDGRHTGTPLATAAVAAQTAAAAQHIDRIILLTDGVDDPQDQLDCHGGGTAVTPATPTPLPGSVELDIILYGQEAQSGKAYADDLAAAFGGRAYSATAKTDGTDQITSILTTVFSRL